MKKLPLRKKRQNERALASLPRDNEGFLDERKIFMLCSKVGLKIHELEDITPFEFVCLVEGYNEALREQMEAFTVAVYSGAGQLFSKKAFQNPFTKQEEAPQQEKVVASKEGQEHTFNKLKEMFGIEIPNSEDNA